MTHKITFVKYARNCTHNINAKRDGAPLIYDYEVVVDGEKRAIFERNSVGMGYKLRDMAHRPINHSGYHLAYMGCEVKSQKQFLSTVEKCLERGILPTKADCDAFREAQEAERVAIDKRNEDHAYEVYLQSHAAEMYAQLLGLQSYLPSNSDLLQRLSRQTFDELRAKEA